MFFSTGNAFNFEKVRVRMTVLLLAFLKNKIVFIFVFFSFLCSTTSGQCPGKDYFKQKINTISNSKDKNPEIQLKWLLQVKEEMNNCRYQKDSVYMYLLRRIGLVYFKQVKYDSAVYYTNQSIQIAKILLQNNKCLPLALVDNYYTLFYIAFNLEQEQNELNAIDSCITYFLRGNLGTDKALTVLQSKVEYFYNKGDYSQCINTAKLGEEIVQKSNHIEDSIGNIVFFVNYRANALYYGNELDSAKEILINKIVQFEKIGQSNQLGNIFSALGLINNEEGKYKEALYFLWKGFEKFAINKYGKGLAQNLVFIGRIEGVKLRNYDAGLKYLSTSLKYADAMDSSNVFTQKGNIYSLKNRFDSAQYFFQKAYNAVQPGMDENTLLQKSFQFPGYNQLQDLSDLATDKGDAYVRQYNFTHNNDFLKKAISVFKKNDLFLGKIRTEQKLQIASSLVWNKTARSLYEHAIDACYANKNIEDAFYFFEKSRAILLNDQVNEQRWKADSDIVKEATMKKLILEMEQKVATISDSSEENITLRKKLYVANQQYDLFINRFKSRNPVYYENYIDNSTLSISQLRKDILKDKKTLVEIFSGDSAVYVLTISGINQSIKKIDKKLYAGVANLFNAYISNPSLLNRDFKGWIKTSRQLYNLLFQNNIIADGRMIISPDGINFPFEALIISVEQEPDYFLNHYATSYTYSAKYLTNHFAANTNGGSTIFGMAPVKYNADMHLAPLSGSDNSLNKINDYFSNATNVVLEKATKSRFLQNFPDYSIIQLYTHASDSSDRNDPVIYFADSALYLSNLLLDRRPVTQLVVLSACETANGKFYEGEGIFSFNRGFAALGIPAAISNLWSVENESTYRITELFYKYLSKGLPTDVALQKAKLEFIEKSVSKEKKLPYYWAGAILTGKADILENKQPSLWLWISIAFIVLLGIVFLMRKILIKKKVIGNTELEN
ncbi:MAG: CHAT domain-containing protein [Ginsengibacter sp.]